MFIAYIDPGLGALLWQSIVAGCVGFLFYLKKTRRWIVGLFRKPFSHNAKSAPVPTLPPDKVAARAKTGTGLR